MNEDEAILEDAREQGRQEGYEERDDEAAEEYSFREEGTPKERGQEWWKWSKPANLEYSRLKKGTVPSVGTTFYPKEFQPIVELYHKINRLVPLKKSFYARMTEEDEAEDVEDRFRMWTRKSWYRWKDGNEIFWENVATQDRKQDADSLSRRSEQGSYLKEVNAQRRFIERKKDSEMEKLAGKGGR